MSNEKKHSHGFGWLGMWIVFCILFYVLSIGPAALVHKRCNNSAVRKSLEFIYAPVAVLVHTPLEKPLVWWVELWIGPAPYK